MALVTVNSAKEWAERFGKSDKRTVVTIGNFDGVHRGHQKILQNVVEDARRTGALRRPCSHFFRHPARVLRPVWSRRATALDTRSKACGVRRGRNRRSAGRSLRRKTGRKIQAADFAKSFLVETMRAEAVLVGENFRFGHSAAGRRQAAQRTWLAIGFHSLKSCSRLLTAVR